MLRDTIKELSTTILNNLSNFDTVKNTIDEIHKNYIEATNIAEYKEGMQHNAAVPTASGMALSLNHAAACLLDYNRTAKFLSGMVSLIREKQQEHPNETINIFYAGCGPFAPFVTLIAPLFKASEVQFTVLEINTASIKMAEELITALHITDYVTEFHNADAVTFQIPDAKKYHILFSETLDALLYRESYVPILWNMLPQLSENCAVIPNNVVVQANFTFPQKKGEDTRREQKAAVILNVREAVTASNGKTELPETFEAVIINLESEKRYHTMIIDTNVHIHKDIWLQRNESSLSIPFEMEIAYPLDAPNVTFSYKLKPSVELTLQN